MRRESGEHLVQERKRRAFASWEELLQRGQLHRDELTTLASIGACASLGLSRRSALWQGSAWEGPKKPLLAHRWPQGEAFPLPEMRLRKRCCAHFHGTWLTVGPHPLHLYRAQLRAQGFLSAAELSRCRDRKWAMTGGVVIVRQGPSTAKGICFATLEDETGFIHVVFTPALFTRRRAVITTSGLLALAGLEENRDGVHSLRAMEVWPLKVMTPSPSSQDFH